ncbi:MAG: GH1 family beta-glucosidase [Staphylococcus equorum]|nr:GH1 family beta-glucosidase [Staphylococcus equorum]
MKKIANMSKAFPSDFLWGSATASYQVEGAVYQGGKGETSWDKYYKLPGKTYDGDSAADHYNRYKEDIKLMKEIGQQTYRFSVSWARILPTGEGEINEEGLTFYDNLVNELLRNNIEPNLTVYHWDMPQALMESGGWLNRENVKKFINYAEILFRHFNGRVKIWSTINEPASEVIEGYVQGTHPPLHNYNFSEAFQVSHHYNIATALAVKRFRELKIKGKIGIALNPLPIHPATDNPEDVQAAQHAYDFYSDWYLSPIMCGSYPKEMISYTQSEYNSPILEDGDLELLANNKVDYLGVNYYMRRVAAAVETDSTHRYDQFEFVQVPEGEYTSWGWEIYPDGLYELLDNIVKTYGDIEIMITENGMGFYDKVRPNELISDDYRIDYIKRHILQIKKCLNNGINVTGYYVWSAIDLLSWTNGFDKRYGLIYVDFKTMERRIKKSGYWYKKVIETNGEDLTAK